MTNSFFQNNMLALAALVLGLTTGYLNLSWLAPVIDFISQIFIRLFQFISLPILFFSLLSSLTQIESVSHFKFLGRRTLFYALLTTTIAAIVALIFYLILHPIYGNFDVTSLQTTTGGNTHLTEFLLKIIPNNIFQPFVEYHLFSVLFIAALISWAVFHLPSEQKQYFSELFSSLQSLFMKMTELILRFIPIAVWAFSASLFSKTQSSELTYLWPYFTCIILANLTQAMVVLPALLIFKKQSPLRIYRNTFPALSLAFFTKSSSATLPLSIRCATKSLNIKPHVVNFTLPLCTTINMNACAAFILITVLFVSQSHGAIFSASELIGVLGFSIIAAVGNASVPMGCYFMATSFLVSNQIPLTIMTLILPFYLLLDMLETTINVWSDLCITSIVAQDIDEFEKKSLNMMPSSESQ